MGDGNKDVSSSLTSELPSAGQMETSCSRGRTETRRRGPACSVQPPEFPCLGLKLSDDLWIPKPAVPSRLLHSVLFCFLQASQLGVYRAFVDNYEVAMETAEKCCQANAQFAEISEVTS